MTVAVPALMFPTLEGCQAELPSDNFSSSLPDFISPSNEINSNGPLGAERHHRFGRQYTRNAVAHKRSGTQVNVVSQEDDDGFRIALWRLFLRMFMLLTMSVSSARKMSRSFWSGQPQPGASSDSSRLCAKCNSTLGAEYKMRESYPHHATFMDLHASAEQRCYICSWLVFRIQNDRSTKADTSSSEKLQGPFSRYSVRGGSYYRRLIFTCSGSIDDQNVIGSIICHFYLCPSDGDQNYRPYNELGNVHETYVYRLPPQDGINNLQSRTTGDPEVARRGQEWLHNCINKHRICNLHQDPAFFPPRVLRIEGEVIRVVIANSPESIGPYVALSYCWGPKPSHLCLNPETRGRLHEGISIKELHPTIRESIEFTRWMGFSYIWIDSLCIMQSGPDSDADWQLHVQVMKMIYWNCTLNLVAGRASSAKDGCYTSRDPVALEPCIVDWPIRRNEEQRNAIVYSGIYRYCVGNLPTYSRGWILQEDLLSPRNLILATEQIHWQCSELVHACESFPSGVPGISPRLVAIRNVLADKGKPKSAGLTEWDRIVGQYTKRQITKQEDKLPAIAGVAEFLLDGLQDEYVAGLFRSSLPHSLLWTTASGRTQPQVSPSWSWASTKGQVETYWPLSVGAESFIATVIDVGLELENPKTPFGRVNHGEISIYGPVTPISWERTLEPTAVIRRCRRVSGKIDSRDSTQEVYYDQKPFNDDVSVTLRVDDPETSMGDTTKVIGLFLLLSPYIRVGEKCAEGLLLQADETHPDKFRRIGIVKIIGSHLEPQIGMDRSKQITII